MTGWDAGGAAQLDLPEDVRLPQAFCQEGEEPVSSNDQRPCRNAVADFLHCVLRLAARRLSDLCQRMSFEPLSASQVLEQVRSLSVETILGDVELSLLSEF